MDIGIYQKIGFQDRKDNKPNTYQVDGEAKEILKDNSGLVESGTPLNADNFEHIEEGILQNSRNISSLNNMVEENKTNLDEFKEETTSQLADYETHKNNNTIHVTQTEKNTWNSKQNALGFTPENINNKGKVNGYASLGADGKVVSTQLPSISAGYEKIGEINLAGLKSFSFNNIPNKYIKLILVGENLQHDGGTGSTQIQLEGLSCKYIGSNMTATTSECIPLAEVRDSTQPKSSFTLEISNVSNSLKPFQSACIVGDNTFCHYGMIKNLSKITSLSSNTQEWGSFTSGAKVTLYGLVG